MYRVIKYTTASFKESKAKWAFEKCCEKSEKIRIYEYASDVDAYSHIRT